jgi:hypothetical protein
MKNITKKSIQNSSLLNQVSLFLGQTTLLVCLMLVSFASLQAQVVLQDFSTLKNTSNADVYGGFGGGQTATNALVDDPNPLTSNTVREVTTTATGDVWKGVFFRPQTNYIDLTVTKTVSLKIYTTTASYFKGKIQVGQSGQAAIELTTSEAHTGSGWETLTFTFPAATGEWGEMVVFTNVNASGGFINPPSVLTAYFDDLTAVQGSALPAVPSDSPSAPTNDAVDVISIYSDAYTDITTNYNPSWAQSGSVNTTYDSGDGNNVMVYTNFNYQGTIFPATDLTTMENLHIDIWVADASVRTIKVTPNAGGEFLVTVPVTSGAWNSVDIPLSNFTGLTFGSVPELKFDGQFAADGTTPDGAVRSDVYLDNIYFWKEPAAAGTDATLSDLQIDSATISGFSSGTTSYSYNILEGTTDIPQITAATTTDTNAQTTITQATAIPGDATVVVTAQNGTTTETYTVSYAYVSSPEGTWSFTPTAGAFMVGPGQGTGNYYTSSLADVTTRDCLFDDEYVFNADGSFENVLGSDTWLESWQAGAPAEGCGTPIAPHDGTNPATWSFNPSGTITIVGDGAFLGLAKVTNTNELGDPVDDTITYTLTSITNTNMTLDIQLTSGAWWRFLLTKQAAAGSDATLSSLEVDSTAISGFSTVTTSYTYEVAVGASIPQITAATPTDANANTSITQATSIPGDATVLVTAQDGTNTQTYTVSYFYDAPTTGAPSPPSRYAGDVISIFGDTYTNVPIDNYNPNWGQAGFGSANTSYDPGDGSTLLYYPNFNYQGIQLVGGHDASDMEYLHVDLWTLSTSAIKVSPINSGEGPGDALQTISHTIGSWTSVDIPIGDFTGMTWDNVIQMKFDGGNGTTDAIYVDNIYFWKSSACSSTTIWDGAAWSNGAPDANAYAIINGTYSTGTNGDLTACIMQIDADMTIDTATDTAISEILVTAGNTLTVDGTSSLTVTGDFTNSGTVTLNSTSDDFSSLIVSGAVTGDITYNRFVNSYNDGFGGGWDLVGSPAVMTIKDFITANGANIQVLGDDYAFSQYDNAAGDWIRYATGSQVGSFTTGQGYSMATVEVSPPPPGAAGATVAFTGAMQTTSQSINVINNNGLNGVGRRWNLVSNPFPSYINGNTAAGATNFIDTNLAVIDGNYGAVYGWNGSSYTIYNLLDAAFSIAPGQGFWIAAASESEVALDFTAAMRTTTGSGDFVTGPQPLTYYVGLKLYNGETQKAATKFYFRDGLSLGLDTGYDAGAFNQSTKLSTRLPGGSQETAFARNAMGMDAMQNTRVPLEIRQNVGQAFTISIADMELPEDIYVYLEDTLNGTLTSLKDQDFELTAQSDLSGVDRFFIVFKSNSVLSNGDTLGINALNVYKANTDSFVTIAGISPELGKLNVSLYNILGQTVREKALSSATATQRVSTQGLASGFYIVQIKSGNQTTVKKIIVK